MLTQAPNVEKAIQSGPFESIPTLPCLTHSGSLEAGSLSAFLKIGLETNQQPPLSAIDGGTCGLRDWMEFLQSSMFEVREQQNNKI